ncbi:hypothetical protein VNO78_07491 [Psophocarpus tetragonolobus]|uniref:RNase H type-1 domain-containing protein n=1 Tax=Psophocarpus tetragonolobus TaxID=3891 RepID=A0AAN9XSG2_PSOTE
MISGLMNIRFTDQLDKKPLAGLLPYVDLHDIGIVQVLWTPLSEDGVVLHVDGSLQGDPKQDGFGGLVRDCTGNFLFGFYGRATHVDNLYAKVIGLLQGLQLCWQKGYHKVFCYSDSSWVVNMMQKEVQPFHLFANEVTIVRQLLADSSLSMGLEVLFEASTFI